MKLQEEIISNFGNLDSRVESFLKKTITDINTKGIKVTDYTKMILELLVVQLVLYYKAFDEINEDTSVSSEDSYNRKAKSPAISIMQKANDQILVLLDKITLSPLSSAKVKKLNKNDEDDAQELLEALIN